VTAGFGLPVLAWLTVQQRMGFGVLMLISTVGGPVSVLTALFFGPETKAKAMEASPRILRVAGLP
jgi:hypothetical protein